MDGCTSYWAEKQVEVFFKKVQPTKSSQQLNEQSFPKNEWDPKFELQENFLLFWSIKYKHLFMDIFLIRIFMIAFSSSSVRAAITSEGDSESRDDSTSFGSWNWDLLCSALTRCCSGHWTEDRFLARASTVDTRSLKILVSSPWAKSPEAGLRSQRVTVTQLEDNSIHLVNCC